MTAKESLNALEQLYGKYKRDLPRFQKEVKRFMKIGRESGDLFLLGAANYYMAVAKYRGGGERDAVLVYAIKAMSLLAETDQYEMIARCQNMLGIAYLGQENYQMAIQYYQKSLQTIKAHRLTGLSKRILQNNIADSYYEIGDFKASTRLFAECLEGTKRETPDDHKNIVLYSINLASCYEVTNAYEQAKETLDAVAGYVEELNLRLWPCLYNARRASVLYALGDREEGNRCADSALDLASKGTDSYEIHREFEELAHTFSRFGDYARAEKFTKILADYAEKSGHTLDRLSACRAMADYCDASGDTARALEYYKQLDELYRKRMTEVKAMQMTVLKKVREADDEIGKLRRAIKASEQRAAREPMTKLYNRAALLNTASEFIDMAAKKKEKVGAVFIDIDFFKECNDTYGHAKGDEIIRSVAGACLREETATVKFARYGGDEFLGIAHGLGDSEVTEIARRICRRLREADIPNVKNPNGHRVTLSAGVVNVDVKTRGNSIIDIVNFADKALYHAKFAGKDAIYLLDYGRVDEHGNTDIFVRVDF